MAKRCSRLPPTRVYSRFEEIPPLVVHTLLFIENRELRETASASRNPAIERDRLIHAAFDLGLRAVDPIHPVSGGSTLATQLDKLRHSPDGRTATVAEKGRQLIGASLGADLDGPNTTVARRRIARDYVNSLPLGAIAGHGEVTGLGDGCGPGSVPNSTRSTACLEVPRRPRQALQRSSSERACPGRC